MPSASPKQRRILQTLYNHDTADKYKRATNQTYHIHADPPLLEKMDVKQYFTPNTKSPVIEFKLKHKDIVTTRSAV